MSVFWRYGDPVRPVHAFNLAGNLILIDVDHVNLCSMRDVQAASRLIDRKIVPSTFTGDRNLLDKVIVDGEDC
jgi:hypothetical protein